MAYEEFSGELDKPTEFVEFTGKLDQPSPVSKKSDASVPIAEPTTPEKGLIEKVGDFFRPTQKGVMDGYVPTKQEEQSNLDARLSYGAGPISQEVVNAAQKVRGSRGSIVSNDPDVKKVIKGMDAAKVPTFTKLTDIANDPVNVRAARNEKADEFRSPGEWAADTIFSVAQGATSLVQLPTNIIAPNSPLAKTLRATQKEMQAQESDVLKAQRDILRERVQNEEGFFGKYAETVMTLVTNPALGISEGVKQVPNFLAVLGAAKVGGAVAGGTVSIAGKASPTVALAEAISGGALKAGAQAAGSTAGGVGASMVMAGGDAAGAVFEKLTDPRQTDPKVWDTNPDVQQLIAEGKSRKDAIIEVATAKARMAALITAPLGVLGYMGAESSIVNRGLARGLAEAATVKGAAKTFGKEIVGEQFEEGGTQLGGNVISRTVDPSQKLLEGVPEAMGTALVTSAPFGAVAARGEFKEATEPKPVNAVVDSYARTLLDPTAYDPSIVDPRQTARQPSDVGPSAPTFTNFTAADSITRQAGLIPIVVPTSTGDTNVGNQDALATGLGAGSQPTGNLAGTGLGVAGLDTELTRGELLADTGGVGRLDGQAGSVAVGGSQPVANLDVRQRASDNDLLSRINSVQPNYNNANTEPVTIWTGRSGDGYSTQEAAQSGLESRLKRDPDLRWEVEQMPSGKYRLAGYESTTTETTNGTQATQTQQAETQGQQQEVAPASSAVTAPNGQPFSTQKTAGVYAQQQGMVNATIVQSGNGWVIQPQETSNGRSTEITSAGVAGQSTSVDGRVQPDTAAGRAALPANGQRDTSAFSAGAVKDSSVDAATIQRDLIAIQDSRLKKKKEVTKLEVVPAGQGSNAGMAQKIASIFKAPIFFVKDKNGKAKFNAVTLKGRLYLNADSSAPPITLAMHEVGHNLPSDIKQKMISAVMQTVTPEQRASFLQQFDYSKDSVDKQNEELVMRVIEQDAQKPEFWQKMAERLGDGEFAKLAKEILATLDRLIAGFQKEDSNEFTTDIKRVRDVVADAYAQTLERQGQTEQNDEVIESQMRTDFTDPEDRVEVSTTRPVPAPSKGRTSNSYDEKWVIDGADIKGSKKHSEAILKALRTYNTLSGKGNVSSMMKELHEVVVENLLWLHDLVPENVRARAKLWYDGANRIANDWSGKFDVSVRQTSGVLAVLSPQMDWFKNVSLGERVISIWKNRQNEAWSSGMTAWMRSWVEASKDVDTKASRQAILDEALPLEGVTLAEMTNRQAALYVRAFDEAYNERQYRLVTPEGGFGDYVTNNDDGESSVTWGGFDTIEKAVSILNDGTFKNVENQLGDEHKVRNFFNNIISPGSADGHVTIDTHAVAAALIKGLSGSSQEVADNFGAAGQNAETGASGTYGLFADAYRDAAARRGLLAREMQSITWEAVRALFPAAIKDKLAPQINAVWNRFRKGEITRDEARNEVKKLSGGIRSMAWEGSDAGKFAAAGGESYASELDADPAKRQVRTLPPEIAKDKITINLSANTNAIAGVANLQAAAAKGNEMAHRLLQDIALDNLKHLLSGTSAFVKSDGVTGLYGGSIESGLSLTVSFADNDREVVLAALAKFADNFNQEQVHVRRGVKAKAGTVFEDGSYATPVYTWELNKTLTRKNIERIINQSGLYGLTFGDDFVEAYYVGDFNEEEFVAFERSIKIAAGLVGKSAKSSRRTVERLWPYGEGTGTIGFGRIQGDVPAGTGVSSKTAKRVAEYLNAVKGTDGKMKMGKVKAFDQAEEITPKQEKLQAEIAQAFAALPVNDLKNPIVKRAYKELATEVLRQFKALPIKVEVQTQRDAQGDIIPPYNNSSAEMRRDILDNNHLLVYPTTPETFGPQGEDFSSHPLLADAGVTDMNGAPMLVNDVLRAVHDYYAHSMSPVAFGPKGEEAAWKNHMSMTPNMYARWALTMETRAQNSFVNFRADLDKDTPLSGREFAPQKAALLPAKYSLTGNPTVDKPMKEFISKLGDKVMLGSKPDKVQASEQRDAKDEYDAVVKQYKGTPEWMKTPNGKPTKLNERQWVQVRTPSFKNWFGDWEKHARAENPVGSLWSDDKVSKVVDENGEPLVVYHGTTSGGFSAFQEPSGLSRADLGIFTTPNLEMARSYPLRGVGTIEFADMGRNRIEGGDTSGVYATFVNLRNPNESDFEGANWDGARNNQFEIFDENGEKLYAADGKGFFTDDELDVELARLDNEGISAKAEPAIDNFETTDSIVKDARKYGNDGAIIRNVVDQGAGVRTNYSGDPSDVFVALKPNQVKSADQNNGEFGETSDMRFSDNRNPTFYSQLARVIDGVSDKLATQPAAQWKLWIKSNAGKLQIKQEEIEWSGINDYLDLRGKDKVTKAEIADYLSANGVQVEEVMKGGEKDNEQVKFRQALARMDNDELSEVAEQNDVDHEYVNDTNRAQIINDIVSSFDNDPFAERGSEQPKYASYQLLGGDNYRELLLTLPAKEQAANREQFSVFNADGELISQGMWPPSSRTQARLDADPSLRVERQSVADQNDAKKKGLYQSSHWNEANVLAHIRMNDRIDADGNKVLFIEELQSDWAQEGRKKGFNGKSASEIEQELLAVGKERSRLIEEAADLPDSQMAKFKEMNQRIKELGEQATQLNEEFVAAVGKTIVPSAPFVQDTKGWLSLGIKRVIAYAAENGYDKVAFVNGEQSADRYDLSKQVESIAATKKGDGTYALLVSTKKGDDFNRTNVPASGLEEIVGKEMATKIVEATEGDSRKAFFSGLDLKVGGEGMKSFYDKIVPQTVSDVLKKLGGGKVESVTINGASNGFDYYADDGDTYAVIDGDGNFVTRFDSREGAAAEVDRLNGKTQATQSGFNITDAMRDKVAEGLPMFSEKRAKVHADAASIAKLSEETRDNMEIGEFQGGSQAYNLYEAKKLQPKPSEKLKRVNENNSFSLWQDYDYIANVDGTHFGVTKQEDPDAEDDDDTSFIFAFNRMDDQFGSDGTTYTTDVADLFKDMRAAIANDGGVKSSEQRKPIVGQNFTLPKQPMRQTARIKLQDDALRMRRVIEAVKAQGGTVGEAQNFYDANTLMPGRIQSAVNDFRNDVVLPMIDKAVAADIELDELALYAYAMHAPERNAYIASINKRFPDGGSGMTNADAAKIIADVKASGKQAGFDDLHKDLMAITATTRQMMVNEGLITQDEFDAMDGAYDNYVPLRGLENVDENSGAMRPGVGRGINVRGKETIRALGRRSRASDVIENALRDYQRAVQRVEKNDVAKVLLDFVLSNPDPDLWEVDVEKTNAGFDKTRGVVQYTKVVEKGEDTIGLKVGGKQVYIKIADPDLARGLRQAWKDEVSGFERVTVAASGWFNSWMRNVLTRYNPLFAAVNIAKDALWSGNSAALAELGFKGTGKYLANYGKALMASGRSEAGASGTTSMFGNPVMDRYFKEFESAGAITGGFYMKSLDDINADLRADMLKAGATPNTIREVLKTNLWNQTPGMARALKAVGVSNVKANHVASYLSASGTMKALEFIGSASENATRFALYMAARESGRSPVQAALLAKNGTTNFNRKGEFGGALNNLFLFFNAGMQGTQQLGKVLQSKKVQAVMMGVAGTAMMAAFYGAAVGGDDEDGEAYWDKLPDYEKERNLIIMLPPGDALGNGMERVGKRGRYLKVPVQYGFNFFPNLGYMAADVIRNQQDPKRGRTASKAAMHMTSVVFGSVNPFGGSVDLTDGVQVLLAVAPTLADLPIQLVNERGTFGTPSAPAQSAFDPKPDSERMYTSQQNTVPSKIAKVLNELGGGNEGKAGSIMGFDTSVTPGTIKTLISATTGGLGNFVEKMFTTGMAIGGQDKDLKASSMPFVSNFYGEVDEGANIRKAGDRMRDVAKAVAEITEQVKVGIEPTIGNEETKMLALGDAQETYQKAMSQLRKDEIMVIKSDMTEPEKKLIRQQLQSARDQLATEINRAYLEMLKMDREGAFKK